jgi:hypothetical protein
MSVKLSCIGQAIRGYVDFSRMLILQKVREDAIYQKRAEMERKSYLRRYILISRGGSRTARGKGVPREEINVHILKSL